MWGLVTKKNKNNACHRFPLFAFLVFLLLPGMPVYAAEAPAQAEAFTEKSHLQALAQNLNLKVITPEGEEILAQSARGEWYLFLPSYLDLDRLVLCPAEDKGEGIAYTVYQRKNPENALLLDGKGVSLASWYGAPEKDGRYLLTLEITKEGVGERIPFVIMQSANISAVYLNSKDPAKAGIGFVEAKKGNKAKTEVRLVDPFGTTVCQVNGEIKGRGNSTWYAQKKPYQIKLERKADLLNRGGSGEEARIWILLANAFDQTRLHNAYSFEIGKALHVLTPDGMPVDLYYDGMYRGSYYLCEKAELGPGRVDIGKGALIELDCAYGVQEETWFQIPTGACFVIKEPKKIEKKEADKIRELFTDIWAAAANGGVHPLTGFSTWDYLDLESFARYYAVQRYVSNADAYFSSTYFYIPEGETKVYTGPLWDLDDAFGMRADVSDPRLRRFPMGNYWIDLFLEDEAFAWRVREVYRNELYPLSGQGLLKEWERKIAASVHMDETLWEDPKIYKTYASFEDAVNSMQSYIRIRRGFLLGL